MSDVSQANKRLLRKLALSAVAMFGFGFALVPLYNIICDITGLNGKTNTEAVALSAVQGEVDASRTVTVEFLATTNVTAPWQFAPNARKMVVHPGEFYKTSFFAKNLTDQTLIGQAAPSVAPGTAARHFQKIECFCFSRQAFAPGEAKDMPLVFRIDPALSPAISTITLSYTFFNMEDGQQTMQ